MIKCAIKEGESIRFRRRDVKRGLFDFNGTIGLENFADKYAKQKGLGYKTGKHQMTQWLSQAPPVVNMG